MRHATYFVLKNKRAMKGGTAWARRRHHASVCAAQAETARWMREMNTTTLKERLAAFTNTRSHK